MEDLKILLGVEYEAMSFSLVIRNIGYMVVTVFIGLVIDKLVNYSEALMALAKLLIILRKI
jgi:F0F1-type ATP synthase assembly protein I